MTSETSATDLAAGLARIGLSATAAQLPDFLARATKSRFSPTTFLEEVVRQESLARAQKSVERRLKAARIGSFRPMADFDWNWPKKIERDLIERALTLDFVRARRNLVLLSTNGLGKTMISKNIASLAVNAGFSVIFRTASDLLADLSCADSPERRRRRLAFYARPDLVCVDEVGYLSYDDRAADLLYEVINRRYERRSLLITTNLEFARWNTVFPNATCLTTLLDR
ncbi:MAG: AAA family ATPase, partial [Dehalococcoidia bacterium]